MKKPILAANWKMNKNPEQTRKFFDKFLSLVTPENQEHFLFFLPATNLIQAALSLAETSILWGGQNCHFKDSGAFTGETSPQVLFEMGARTCLVGHSERRTLFSETDEDVSLKVEALSKLKMIPLICVGETLEQRQGGETLSVVERQIEKALEKTTPQQFLVAYEPVWAIGTGQVAKEDQVQEVHDFLKTKLPKHTPVLYGGSVKSESSQKLSAIDSLDGFLVGGSSLEPESFFSIYSLSV